MAGLSPEQEDGLLSEATESRNQAYNLTNHRSIENLTETEKAERTKRQIRQKIRTKRARGDRQREEAELLREIEERQPASRRRTRRKNT